MHMLVVATAEHTEIEVRVDGALVYAHSMRAERSNEPEIFEAVRISLQRTEGIGVPDCIRVRGSGDEDEAFGRRLALEIGIPVELI